MSRVSIRTVLGGLVVVFVAALSGCGQPEGLGSVDAEAARQALIAEGRPDPLGAPGQARFQQPPQRSRTARRR